MKKSAAISFEDAFSQLTAEMQESAEETRQVDEEREAAKQSGSPEVGYQLRVPKRGSPKEVALGSPKEVAHSEVVDLGSPTLDTHGHPKVVAQVGSPEVGDQNRVPTFGSPKEVDQNRAPKLGSPLVVAQTWVPTSPKIGLAVRRVLAVYAALNYPGHPFTTNLALVAQQLGIPKSSARNAYQRLVELGLVQRCEDPCPVHNQVLLRIDPAKLDLYGISMSELEVYLSREPKLGSPNLVAQNRATTFGSPTLVDQNREPKVGHPELGYQTAPLREIEKDQEKSFFLSLTAEDIEECWPHLAAAGMNPERFAKIAKLRTMKGLDFSDIRQSLEFANAIAGDPERMQKIKSPADYFFASLRDGPMERPGGYKTARERQVELMKEEMERDRIAALEEADLRLDRRIAELSEEERESVLSSCSVRPTVPAAIRPLFRRYFEAKRNAPE